MAVADARASQVHSAYVTPLRRGGFDDNKDTAAERDDDENTKKKKREDQQDRDWEDHRLLVLFIRLVSQGFPQKLGFIFY